jgi:endo-1,4-beta-xylanase
MRDTLDYYIKKNIRIVLNHFKGRIKNWDCVNESLDVFKASYHNNIYHKYLGKEYIADAFRYAHEIDPDVELYLNEQFDEYDSEKALFFLEVVKELIEIKVPIHEVGILAHALFTIPDLEAFEWFIGELSALGLKREITELDARLRLFDDYEDPYKAQGDFYNQFITICIKNQACQGVTIWSLNDKINCYDKISVFNFYKPNLPNLFDEDMHKKPTY